MCSSDLEVVVVSDQGGPNVPIYHLNQWLKFNPNILTENAPYPAVMGIGTAENQMNRLQLEKIGNIIGKDLVGDTEKLAAAQYMNKAGLLPNIKNFLSAK